MIRHNKSRPAAKLLLLAFAMVLVGCGGGSAAGRSNPATPPTVDPDVYLLEVTGTSRRLVGMASDGSGSRVLLPDASAFYDGQSTYRSGETLVYALRGVAGGEGELRTVSLDGKTNQLLRPGPTDVNTNVMPQGIRNNHLVVFLRGQNYFGPVESLPLAGGAAVVQSTQASDIRLGANSMLLADLSSGGAAQYRVATVGAQAFQPFASVGELITDLASGGKLMGSVPGTYTSPLSLLTGDFLKVRELAPAGAAPNMAQNAQNPMMVPPELGDWCFGVVPEGAGLALMAYSRSGAAPVRLDASTTAGAAFSLVGVLGTSLVYRLELPAGGGEFLRAYRAAPIAGGTPVNLTPVEPMDYFELVLGLTSSSLVIVVPEGATTDVARVKVIPVAGGSSLDTIAYTTGSIRDVQARVVGDRMVFVGFDGTTYRLGSVNHQGLDPKAHFSDSAALRLEDPNSTGVFQGRVCVSRGSDLLLLDPTQASPTTFHNGTARTVFSGWSRTRLLMKTQEPGNSNNPTALWSARLDGSDLRKLSDNGWTIRVQ